MVPTLFWFSESEYDAGGQLPDPVVGRASWGEGDLPLAGDGGGEPKRESSSSAAGVVMDWDCVRERDDDVVFFACPHLENPALRDFFGCHDLIKAKRQRFYVQQ